MEGIVVHRVETREARETRHRRSGLVARLEAAWRAAGRDHGLPAPARRAQAAELVRVLDPDLMAIYLLHDGWPGLVGGLDLVPASELLDPPVAIHPALTAVDEAVWRSLAMTPDTVLPIMRGNRNDEVVVMRRSAGLVTRPVMWFSPAGIERFYTVPEFLEHLVGLHRGRRTHD